MGRPLLRPLNSLERAVVALVLVPVCLIAGAFLVEIVEPQGRVVTSPVHLYLTIGFNFTTQEDQYFPANFSIPADVEVVVTITNYDNATNPVSNQEGKVTGTVGNTATANGTSFGSIPGSQVSHTFSVLALGINVPIPASSTVVFSLMLEQPGTYAWHCLAPCDTNAMGTPGFMEGTLTVGS